MIDPRTVDILDIIPQRPPFVMIGRLLSVDLESATTETLIRPENIFVENGRFSACGITENIAQTCAAKIGFVNKYIYRRNVRIGFIGAIRELAFASLPPVGSTVRTTIRTVEEIFGMTMVDATVECDGTSIATTRMKIALSKDEEG